MTIQRGAYLIGVFNDQTHAVDAVQALRRAGFAEEQLALLSRDSVPEAPDRAQVKLQHKAGKGATVGAAVGSGLGVAAGAVAGALVPGALVIGALGGGALGAALGAFAGPFVALGISEDIAQQYAHHVEAGRSVVVVETEPHTQDKARAILQEHGAYDDSMNAD